MTTQNVAVTFHTTTQILNGNLSLPEGSRISEFVNSPAPFIKLTEVSIFGSSGKIGEAREVFINRDNVQMIVTADDVAKGVCLDNASKKMYPYVKKTTIETKIYSADFELTGSLYVSNAEGIPQLLSKDALFLPCTNVKLHDTKNDVWTDAGFVAINKKQINLVQPTTNP